MQINRTWLKLKPGLASLVNLALVLSIIQPLVLLPAAAEAAEEEEESETGLLFGRKYHDQNANGLKDDGEPGLAGVTIKLYDGSEVASTTLTDSEGYFGFYGVAPEDYRVCEEVPAGWQQTDPHEAGGSSAFRAEGRHKCVNDTWGYDVTVNAGDEIYGLDFGNVKGGFLMGIKYRDSNNNGRHDGDETEPKLGGWTIKLYQGEEEVAETVTGADGYYSFSGLRPGDYRLCEVLPETAENWHQTDPHEDGGSTWRAEGRVFCQEEETWGYQIDDLNWGDENYGYDFGNVPGGLISGWKYWDENANGERDGVYPDDEAGEKGIVNHPIKLYQINEEEEWEVVATTYTLPDLESKGVFNFTGLEPGDYYVCEEMSTLGEWQQTDPREDGGSSAFRAEGRVACPNETWGYKIEDLDWGDENYGYNFGNHKYAAVRVIKLAAPNTTDVFKFILTGPNDYEEMDTTIGSTPEGEPISFLRLLPGVYQLTEEVPEGWSGEQNSTCTDGVNNIDPGSITLTSGLQVSCTFNNTEYGVITGYKFEDENADGSRAANPLDEAGLSGWTIKLYQNGELGLDEVKSTVTDAAGFYSFGELLPGTYYVCEDSQGGWTQSAPGSGYTCPNGTVGYTVELEAGEIAADHHFGNWQYGALSGSKWEDANGDGEWDNTEGGSDGWTIYLDDNGNDLKDEDEDTEETGEDGSYYFGLLKPGVYTVREAAVNGWVQTYPEDGEHTVTVRSGEESFENDFGNHFGIIDTEAPETIITSPNPETEWTDKILITGTTTDNVAVASITLAFAIYDGEGCESDFNDIITLNNPELDSVFDWLYEWIPEVDGDYCIRANGIDTSGNVEHTATVFPIKFKKVAQATTTPPTPEEEEENTGGGGSSRRRSTTSNETLGSGTTTNNTSGTSTPLALPVLPSTLSFLTGGTDNQTGAGAPGVTATTTATTTATSSEVLANESLLAALGGIGGDSWLWLLLLLILLAIIGGYWYWQKRDDNY